MRDLARVVTVVLATAAVLLLVWSFRQVLLLLLLAITLATLVAPAIRRVTRWGIHRLLAVGIVYAAATVAAGAVAAAVSGALIQDAEHIVEDLGEVHQHIGRQWREGNVAQRYVARILSPLEDADEPITEGGRSAVLRELVGIGGGLLGLVIAVFLTAVVSIYWSIDYHRIERLWLLLLPLKYRIPARQVWRRIQAEVGTYMRSELLQALVAGVVLGLAFYWSRFPYPVTLAAVVAATWLIPWLGPLLAVAAIWAASLLNFMDVTPVAGLARGIVSSGFALVVFVVLEFVVEPKLVDHRRYSSLLVLVTTVILFQLVGLPGLVLGPPVAIAIQIMAGQVLFRLSAAEPTGPPADLSALDERFARIRGALDRPDNPPPRRLENILGRVGELLKDSAATLESKPSAKEGDEQERSPDDRPGGIPEGGGATTE